MTEGVRSNRLVDVRKARVTFDHPLQMAPFKWSYSLQKPYPFQLIFPQNLLSLGETTDKTTFD